MDIAKLLQEKAAAFADKPAVIFKEQKITFRELKEKAFSLAEGLQSHGLKKGDRVAVYLGNWPEYVLSYLAVWACGGCVVPLDFMLTEEELASCINHSEAVLLIAKEKPAGLFAALKSRCPGLKEIIACHERPAGCLSFGELLTAGKGLPAAVKIEDKDYAIIFYTSGTTGRPKGVLINYRQLGAPPESMNFFVSLSDKDTAVCALPFSHLGGLIYIQNCISFAMTFVLMERFSPLEFLKNVENYRATCFWIVPSMYYAFLQTKEFESADLSSLRWIVCFGASSSPDALRRFHQFCPQAELLNGWGLTETNAPTCVLPMGSKKIESVGRPAPWIKIGICDDTGHPLPQGQVGEVVVQSWVVTDGYYKDPQATAEALSGGWFHSGDLGRFDQEGFLYIVGRKKEMIKVAGEIVFEPEVEAALQKYQDIAEAAVVGVADKLRGEVPKAFVVLKPGAKAGEEELRYFLRQHLAHFKIPHYFEFCDSLPKNRTGKVDKEKLRTSLSKG